MKNQDKRHVKSEIHWGKGFIRGKVERVIRLTEFPLKTCGNDEEKQPVKVVILGLDPGIHGVFNLNTKEVKMRIPADLLHYGP